MSFKLKTIIEAKPTFIYSFMCPNCNFENPVTFNAQGLIPCKKCGYKFYPQSFEKIYENVMDKVKRETSAIVLNF